MTVFLGCGFAAKYREGGGVFSVPLQWMLGLKRLELDAIWLEVLPGSGNETADRAAIKHFATQLLRSERTSATLGPQEILKSERVAETLTGSARYIFWGVLGIVVIALLVLISRLLPKTT